MRDIILAVLLFIASVFFVICFILAGITLVLRLQNVIMGTKNDRKG